MFDKDLNPTRDHKWSDPDAEGVLRFALNQAVQRLYPGVEIGTCPVDCGSVLGAAAMFTKDGALMRFGVRLDGPDSFAQVLDWLEENYA